MLDHGPLWYATYIGIVRFCYCFDEACESVLFSLSWYHRSILGFSLKGHVNPYHLSCDLFIFHITWSTPSTACVTYWTASGNGMGMFHMHAAVSPAQQGAWHGHRSMSIRSPMFTWLCNTSGTRLQSCPEATRFEFDWPPCRPHVKFNPHTSKHMIVSRQTYICGCFSHHGIYDPTNHLKVHCTISCVQLPIWLGVCIEPLQLSAHGLNVQSWNACSMFTTLCLVLCWYLQVLLTTWMVLSVYSAAAVRSRSNSFGLVWQVTKPRFWCNLYLLYPIHSSYMAI